MIQSFPKRTLCMWFINPHRLKKTVSKPFENLNALERLIQSIRLFSSVLIICLSLVLTVGALVNPKYLYMGKLNTSSVDIANGLLDVLKNSVESSRPTNINNGVGLTTSEILILTKYAEAQVNNVPQYITSSIYSWCATRYNTTSKKNIKGKTVPVRNTPMKTTCERAGSSYIFDYRDLLSDLGLDIVLNYAYDSDNNPGISSSYSNYLVNNRHIKVKMINLLYTVACIQFILFVCTMWYYFIKGRSLNVLKERILIHSISLGSLVVFICTLISAINLASLNIKARSKIEVELQGFGFSYHLGNAWFVFLWLLVLFSFVSCLVWSGLEWCISDNNEDQSVEYQIGIETVMRDDTECSHTAASTETLFPPKNRFPSGKNLHTPFTDSNEALVQNNLDTLSLERAPSFQTIEPSDSNSSSNVFQRVVKPSSTLQF